MNAEELRARQKPFKDRYRADPAAARKTLCAQGDIDAKAIACRIAGAGRPVVAGLHPATGGSGEERCSAEMLLEALVGCAGVTLAAVATAMNIPLSGGMVRAEGELDFRGTLGVSKDVPVGFQALRLSFQLDTQADDAQLQKLIELTERYCVVFQTLRVPPEITVTLSR